MIKKFQRKIEDFVCENCGTKVVGNGYTNHCPNCLFSKHVDVNPGDREENCGGLMDPIFAEVARDGYVIVQKCKKCGKNQRNKVAEGDNIDAIIEVMKSVKP